MASQTTTTTRASRRRPPVSALLRGVSAWYDTSASAAQALDRLAADPSGDDRSIAVVLFVGAIIS